MHSGEHMIYELQRNFSSTDVGYKFIISLSNKISPEIRKLNFSRSESWARALTKVGVRRRKCRSESVRCVYLSPWRVVKKPLFRLCAETIIESHFYYTQPRF
jgi:hypothetical protein